jgi:hypothetical protein
MELLVVICLLIIIALMVFKKEVLSFIKNEKSNHNKKSDKNLPE